MTKKKTETDLADSEAEAADSIVTIERGPWEIDKAAEDFAVQDFGNVVHVTTNGVTYQLTRDEAAPFLPEDEGIAQSK